MYQSNNTAWTVTKRLMFLLLTLDMSYSMKILLEVLLLHFDYVTLLCLISTVTAAEFSALPSSLSAGTPTSTTTLTFTAAFE